MFFFFFNVIIFFVFFFFFSSRRRHTRWNCDWSSDVCSSDLAVSEGLRNREGKFLSETGLKDAFGHSQLGGAGEIIAKLVKDRLKYKYHWALADYLQRSARHIASKVDVEQSYKLGVAAVKLALAGKNAVMPIIERVSNKP